MKRLYSSRLDWGTPENRIAALRTRVRGYHDLTVSNPTQAGLAYPEDEIVEALASAAALRYQPSPLGLLSAREAVCRYYDGAVSPDSVLLTASTSEAYSYLLKLFCDPGDEVLVPTPSYPLFDFLASLEGVRPIPYRFDYDGQWHLADVPVTERTRAIIVVSPNNPTGASISNADIDRLISIGLPVILDEVFRDYGEAVESGQVFRLNGLSKAAALPQMKLGWIVCPGKVPDALELIADTYLSVGAPVQHALPKLLDLAPPVRNQIRERCAVNLQVLRAKLGGTPLTPLRVDGGWTAPVEILKTRSEEEWVCRLLEDAGVLVQPGYFYDFRREAFIIVSLLTQPSTFETGLDRAVSYLC